MWQRKYASAVLRIWEWEWVGPKKAKTCRRIICMVFYLAQSLLQHRHVKIAPQVLTIQVPTSYSLVHYQLHRRIRNQMSQFQRLKITIKNFRLRCSGGQPLQIRFVLLVFTMRKNLPKTLDQLIFCQYLVNSYHQKGVKHYVLTN